MTDCNTNSYPLVSIIMNCFNGEKYLKEAINSVYAQTYPNWEVVFIDNASTDKTAVIAHSYDDRIKCFRNSSTISLGESRNLALKYAEGDFLAFLDCDDVWEPNKLELQIPLFIENKNIGIVTCQSGTLNLNSKVSTGDFLEKKSEYNFRDLLSNYFIIMSSSVIRRTALDILDEWFDCSLNIAEEADLFLRLSLHWAIGRVHRVLCYYRLHENNTHRSPEVKSFPNEIDHIFLKLENAVPDFQGRYGFLKTKWLNMSYSSVLRFYWHQGDFANSYRILFKIKPQTFKAIIRQIVQLFLILFKGNGLRFYTAVGNIFRKTW
jgi:glycosyltransferase involved in cell wall biosynthesis